MGIFSKIKGWLNIGGVSVKLEGINPEVYAGMVLLEGKVCISSKSDREVLSVTRQIVQECRYQDEDDETQTEIEVLGESDPVEPFTIAAGETRELEFEVLGNIDAALEHRKGAIGALGKLMGDGSNSWYAYVKVDVKGTALDPKDKIKLKVKSISDI